MEVNLSCKKTSTISDLKFPTSYEIPVIVLNESETKSDIKGCHAYMNSWKPIIGYNLQTCPESKNKMNKYAVAVLIDTQIVGHLTKGKSGRYAKTKYRSMVIRKIVRAIGKDKQMTSLSVLETTLMLKKL